MVRKIVSRLVYYRRGNSLPALCVLVVRDVLAKAGVDIVPYYLMREAPSQEPPAEPADVACRRICEEDLGAPCRIPGWSPERAGAALAQGDVGFAAWFENEMVAVTWGAFAGSSAGGLELVELQDRELYLYGAATHPAARGMGLAPYLRSLMYRDMQRQGVERFISLSFAFNTPSIRFKEKLGGWREGLWIWIRLFGGRPRRLIGRRRVDSIRPNKSA